MKKLAITTLALAIALAGCAGEENTESTATTEIAESSAPEETTPAEPEASASTQTSAAPQDTATADRVATSKDAPEDEPEEFTTGPSASSEDPYSTLAQALPIEVRVGVHDGYDRVVVEYDGAEAPVEWVSDGFGAEGIQEGSGFTVDLGSNRVLETTVWGIRYPDTNDVPELKAQIPNGSIVEAVQVDHAFEGGHQIFIGTSEDHPYRVFRLGEPERIVIDIKH